jgi:hypothetical protein
VIEAEKRSDGVLENLGLTCLQTIDRATRIILGRTAPTPLVLPTAWSQMIFKVKIANQPTNKATMNISRYNISQTYGKNSPPLGKYSARSDLEVLSWLNMISVDPCFRVGSTE